MEIVNTSKIEPKVLARLKENMFSLFRAGWTVGKISSTLSAHTSFGHYDGCTPGTIETLAYELAKDMNKKSRQRDPQFEADIKLAKAICFPHFSY